VPPEGDPETPRRSGLREVAPGIPRLDPGLLSRLATLARRWPNRRILIVSGVRPRARSSSRHRVGRALDVIVEGVPRRQVSEFARGLAETGVGYYPNSTFTHIDVRRRAAYWVDLSGPGERPRYVRTVPPEPPQDAQARPAPDEPPPATVASQVDVPAAEGDAPRPAISQLDSTASPGDGRGGRDARGPREGSSAGVPAPAVSPAPAEEPPLSAAEIAALGREALRALEAALAATHLETATRDANPRYSH
jgi:hypothetical protein